MPTPSLDTLDIISPDHYQQHGYPHEEWAQLRREAPIYWYTRTPGVLEAAAEAPELPPASGLPWG